MADAWRCVCDSRAHLMANFLDLFVSFFACKGLDIIKHLLIISLFFISFFFLYVWIMCSLCFLFFLYVFIFLLSFLLAFFILSLPLQALSLQPLSAIHMVPYDMIHYHPLQPTSISPLHHLWSPRNGHFDHSWRVLHWIINLSNFRTAERCSSYMLILWWIVVGRG